MQYKGKLFGKVGKTYFPLILTAEQVDAMERDRDAAFSLLREVEEGHRNIKSRLYYSGCDTDPCSWCIKVRAILPENV